MNRDVKVTWHRQKPNGRGKGFATFFCVVAFLSSASGSGAQEHEGVRENVDTVRTWNEFADAVIALHQAQVASLKVETVERRGGYGGHLGTPDFYKEVMYREASSGRLIGRLQWESGPQRRLHMIEVFVYREGELARDYLVAYLPGSRNAPIQALVNLHGGESGLQAFRQFDASGERVFEQCRGEFEGAKIDIYYDYASLPTLSEDPTGQTKNPLYESCFGNIPAAATPWLRPAPESFAVNLPRASGSDPDAGATAFAAQAKRDFESGRLTESLAAADLAISLDSNHHDAYFWRGMALGRLGELEEAVSAISLFLEFQPESSLGYTKRGIRYFWMGDEVSAERDFRRAIALDSDNAEANDDLGVILARRGLNEAARQHFERTLEIDPSYQKAYHNLGVLYLLKGETKTAWDMVERGLMLDRNAPDLLRLGAVILERMGRGEEAKAWRAEANRLPQSHWSEHAGVVVPDQVGQ